LKLLKINIEGNAAVSQQKIADMITTLAEPDQGMMKTYEGGCAYLMRWHRE
jgi:hypothetical protein